MTTTTSDDQHALEVEGNGSIVEAAGGLAAMLTSIMGLLGSHPVTMMSIAALALGAALLVEGGVVATQYSKLLALIDGGPARGWKLKAGMTTEIVGGAASMVFGVLALLGFAPLTVLPLAVVSSAAAILLASGALLRLGDIRGRMLGLGDVARRTSHWAVRTAAALQAFTGTGALVLAVIALTTPAHASLSTLVGLLALGASVVFSGSALGARLSRTLVD